jgi:radical SAM protein with 4Fe4S-binding SPASM domain
MSTTATISTAGRASAEFGAPFVPLTPFHVVWNVTNACNLRCEHCFAASGRRLPDELTTGEGFDLIDQLAEAGVFDLAFCGGEPFIRRDIFDLLGHAAAVGLTTAIGSNGWRVTDQMISQVKAAGVQRFQISLDGLEGTHDRIRRRQGLFHRSVSAISASVSSGLRTNVCLTVHRGNLTDLEGVIDLCADLGVNLFNLSQFVPVGRGDKVRDLSIEEWRSVLALWQRKRDQYAGQMAFASHLAQLVLVDPQIACQPGFRGCQAGSGQAAVTANGDVWPCVVLPVPVGNVRQRRFAEIWRTSPILIKLRSRRELGGICGSCALKERCGGCRAVAWAYSGDPLAEDPRCWLVAGARQTSSAGTRSQTSAGPVAAAACPGSAG